MIAEQRGSPLRDAFRFAESIAEDEMTISQSLERDVLVGDGAGRGWFGLGRPLIEVVAAACG